MVLTWLPAAGLSVDAGVLIATPGAATKIIEACRASNELTVEAWIKPGNLQQSGPARAVSLSANPSNRDFTLGQSLDTGSGLSFWAMRVRTPFAGNNGSGNNTQFNTQPGTAETKLQRIVFTRDAQEVDTFYIDGVMVEQRASFNTGDFSNWNATGGGIPGPSLGSSR